MTVEWEENVLDRLADFMVEVNSLELQDAIERAVLRVRSALGSDPWELGESRAGNDRVWFVPPIVVAYRIDVDRDTVRVFHVELLRSRGAG